jgi:hypothetical protein
VLWRTSYQCQACCLGNLYVARVEYLNSHWAYRGSTHVMETRSYRICLHSSLPRTTYQTVTARPTVQGHLFEWSKLLVNYFSWWRSDCSRTVSSTDWTIYLFVSFRNNFARNTSRGARRSVDGWGIMLQAGRSRLRILIRSLDFSINLTFPTALWPCGRFSF